MIQRHKIPLHPIEASRFLLVSEKLRIPGKGICQKLLLKSR
nr:MAG TPA: hypothetical protein [Caudoviricetes sp.]DAT94467.1 MAG TPA: hypothetical protein [Caudoviricetes sp.]